MDERESPSAYPAPIGAIIDAQDAGHAAWVAGAPVASCPYRAGADSSPADRFLQRMWIRGYTTAHAEAESGLGQENPST